MFGIKRRPPAPAPAPAPAAPQEPETQPPGAPDAPSKQQMKEGVLERFHGGKYWILPPGGRQWMLAPFSTAPDGTVGKTGPDHPGIMVPVTAEITAVQRVGRWVSVRMAGIRAAGKQRGRNDD